MDFDKMVLAHSKWKTRLLNALQNHEEIDVGTAGQDDQCELGQWIHGEGKRHASLAEYQALKAKHARFHACIPDVVQLSHGRTTTDAVKLIDPFNSEFGQASSECINAITSLKSALGK